MIVVGADPGLTGALAVYDGVKGAILHVCDIPTYTTQVGKRVKSKIDVSELLHKVGWMRMQYGAEMAVIEMAGPRPKESVTSAFTSGMGYGFLYMAFSGFRYRLELVTPQTWKHVMRAPKLKTASGKRADELFPDNKHEWRGPRGAVLHGRAEAAMIAKYGAERFGAK
jgi:crossover junction endodeoxyribonuclease RuvC